MRKVTIGDYIRHTRKEAGLTQWELCDGICSVTTLSRLENNDRSPTYRVVTALLERLGLPSDRYFALLSESENEIEMLKKDIVNECIAHRRALDKERPAIRARILDMLDRLERVTEPNDNLTRMFIMGNRAVYGTREKTYSNEEQLELLLKAIRLVSPRFDTDHINLCLYSMYEMQIIVEITRVYSDLGESKKAIDIYRQLLSYVEEHYKELSRFGGRFCLIAHNYAIELAASGQREQSLALAKRGQDICVKYGHYQFLPGFLAIQAECLFFMGDKEQSFNCYHKAVCLYDILGDEANLEIMKNEIKERHGREID